MIHGIDVVALGVGAVGGGPSAEETRMQTPSKILCRQNAGVFGLIRTDAEAHHGPVLHGLGEKSEVVELTKNGTVVSRYFPAFVHAGALIHTLQPLHLFVGCCKACHT